MRFLTGVLVVLAVAAGCDKKKAATGPGQQVTGLPVETQAPNASDQKPAFAGQTRAPYLSAKVEYDVQVIAAGLEHPWSLAFLPDGAMLVTEKPGRLRMVTNEGAVSEPIRGVPAVDARQQGGLLEVALDPDFRTNAVVFLSFAEPRDNGANGTAVARAKLVRDQPPRLEDVKVIWRMKPDLKSKMHFGGRIVFARDGTMFITTGERSIPEGRMHAQKLDSTFGKVVRINRDGSIPTDNPFVGRADALPEVWSYGHRNMQAAALHPDSGKLWVVDHGARGGDEVNVVDKGKDYGWPTITYGIEYSGAKIGDGITQKAGMEQPIYYWDPVIAPSGMAFYTGELFPAWKGSLFVGGLAAKHIARLTLNGERVIGEERLLTDRARIRDVRVGPDGAIYVLTDEDNGELLKLAPVERPRETAVR